MTSPSSAAKSSGVADEQSLILFYNAFRKFLNVNSALSEYHRRRLKSNRAQDKLRRLSAQQFHELSTDVYDELLRRTNSEDIEFLSPRNTFHPKRNQARRKLALLSVSRFNDLCFDILFEIERRLKDHPTKTAQDAVQNPISAFLTSPPPASAQPSHNPPYTVKTNIPSGPDNRGSLNSINSANTANNHNSFSSSFDYVSASPSSAIPAAYSTSPSSQRASHLSQNTTNSRDSSTQNTFSQFAPPPYDSVPSSASAPSDTSREVNSETSRTQPANSETTPQSIQPTTKTITPAKSTLVEESDSDSNEPHEQVPQFNSEHADDEDVFSEVDDHQDESFQKAPASSQDLIDAAAKAWASKNSSHADLSQLSNSNIDLGHESSEFSSPPLNEEFQDPQPFAQPYDGPIYGPLSLQSIAEEKGPYIPPNLLANGSSNSTNSTGKRKSLSEQISSSIGRPRSQSKSDLDPSGSSNRLPSESQKQLVDLQSEINKLHQQVDAQKDQIQSLVGDSSRVNANVSKLETQLRESESVKETLVQENDRLHQAVVDAEAIREKLEVELSTLHSDISKRDAETSDKDQKVRKIQSELDDTSKEFGLKTEQYITDLEEKQEKIEILEQQNQKLKEKYGEVMKKQSEYAESSASLSSQIMLLEGKLLKHENTISSLQEELQAKDAILETHQQSASSRDTQLGEKDAQIADLMSKLSQTEQNSQSIDKAVEAALAKADQERAAEKQKTEQKVNRLKKELAELQVHTETNSRSLAIGSKGVSKDIENDEKYKALLKERDSIQDNYAKLRAELEQQQFVTEQVRQEASSFLEEMRTLAESTDTNYNNEKYVRQIESLKKEINEWKQRYSKLKAKLRSLKSNSYSSFPHVKVASTDEDKSLNTVDTKYLSEEGKILDTDVIKYQVAMDDFLVKARTSPVKYLMEHLHEVVATTRVITQDVNETFRTEKPIEDGSQLNGSKSVEESDLLQSEIAQATSLVSATATHLITTTRNHSTSGGISPIFLIDAAATDLSQAVVELIKLAKIKPTYGLNSPKNRGTGFDQSSPSSDPFLTRKNRSSDHHHSRTHSSKGSDFSVGSSPQNQSQQHSHHRQRSQSQSSPQSQQEAALPLPVPQDTRSASGPVPSALRTGYEDGHRTVSETAQSPISNLADREKDVQGTGHTRTTPSSSIDYTFPQVSPMRVARLPTGGPEPKESLGLPYINSNASSVLVDPEKRTIKELQEYLESQTAAVVGSIQNLLTGIKGSANYGKVRQDVLTTTDCVRPVIDATSRSMTQTRNWRLKDLGQYIVESLGSSCERMAALHESSLQHEDSALPDRHLKQRLASIAFDIAKSTKELVKIVEEVSIKMDINEIDNELQKEG